jgi:hypothetical protein
VRVRCFDVARDAALVAAEWVVHSVAAWVVLWPRVGVPAGAVKPLAVKPLGRATQAAVLWVVPRQVPPGWAPKPVVAKAGQAALPRGKVVRGIAVWAAVALPRMAPLEPQVAAQSGRFVSAHSPLALALGQAGAREALAAREVLQGQSPAKGPLCRYPPRGLMA